MKKLNMLTSIVLVGILVLGGCASKDTVPASSEASSVPAAVTEAQTQMTEETPEEAPDMTAGAIEAYAQFLEDIKGKPEGALGVFTLVHVDADDTPELAVIPDSAHPSGVQYYTFEGDTVTSLDGYGSMGVGYYERGGGTMLGFYSGMGSTYLHIGEMSGNDSCKKIITEITGLEYVPPMEEGGFTYALYPDGTFEGVSKEVTKEEYFATVEPYLPAHHNYTELRYDDLTPIAQTTDFQKALEDSLLREDDFPKMNLEEFYRQTIWPVEEAPLQAYTAFLQEKKDAMDYMPDSAFSLISLNGSKTPLLAYIYGSAHANGVEFYSFDGEKAELIYAGGGFGTAYYDREEGLMFGHYTGQGETSLSFRKVNEGSITEEKLFRVFNDNFYPELNPDTFEYFEGTDRELSKEDFMERIDPYLPENRVYKVISPDSLPKVAETENFYGALKMTLAQEGALPLLDADTFFTHLIWPSD